MSRNGQLATVPRRITRLIARTRPQPNCQRTLAVGPGSASAAALTHEDNPHRLEDRHEVEPDAVVLDVVEVVFELGSGILDGSAILEVYLRPAGDARLHTVALVEVKPSLSVPWTAPTDYGFDPELPSEGLRLGADKRFHAVLADGSVQLLRGDIAAELMLRLFRKSDGMSFRWDAVR